MRLYELFMGPLEKGAPWSTDGIPGCHRFLQRVWRLFIDEEAGGEPVRSLEAGPGSEDQRRLTAQTIAGVTADMEEIQPNTAISKLMVWARDISREEGVAEAAATAFLRMLSPFAPHLAEELWQRIGQTGSVGLAPWPEADAALLVSETVTLGVQVNGKRRGEVEVPVGTSDAEIEVAALAEPNVAKHVGDKTPKKVIVVKGRLVNVVL